MKSFQKKIVFYMLFSSLILSFLILLSSMYFVNIEKSKSTLENANNSVSQINEIFEETIYNIESTTKSLSTNINVLSYIESDIVNQSLNISLISLVNSYPAISNIALYNTINSLAYVVPQGTGFNTYPTFNSNSENELFNNFISSSKSSFISLRVDLLPKYYDWSLYNNDYGIITIFHKIHNLENDLIGLVSVDIKPSVIFERYLNYEANYLFDKSRAYLSTNNSEIFLKANSTHYNEDIMLINESLGKEKNVIKNNIIISQDIFNYYKVITIVPNNLETINLLKSLLVIFVVFVVSNFSVYIISTLYSKSTINRINYLKQKISRND